MQMHQMVNFSVLLANASAHVFHLCGMLGDGTTEHICTCHPQQWNLFICLSVNGIMSRSHDSGGGCIVVAVVIDGFASFLGGRKRRVSSEIDVFQMHNSFLSCDCNQSLFDGVGPF